MAGAKDKPGKGASREQTVKRMIELRTKENLGVNAIALRLDEEGYPTFGKAKKWPHRVVYGVLLKELGASKMKRKATSKAAQSGTDRKRSTAGAPPDKVEKLPNVADDGHNPVPDGVNAVVVKHGSGDKREVTPDSKAGQAARGKGAGKATARKTSTARKGRKS